MSFRLDCLFSTIKNTSGKAMRFGFLPPHGQKLAIGAEFTVFGDVSESVIRGDRVTSKRNIDAFEAAIGRGDLQILKTPNPVLQDLQTGHTKMVVFKNGNIGLSDPCFTSASV